MTPKKDKCEPSAKNQRKNKPEKKTDPGKLTTRREFIKKGVIAAVYVTPVVESAFISDVEAQGGPCAPGICKPNPCKPGPCKPQPVSPCRPYTCPPARCNPWTCKPRTG